MRYFLMLAAAASLAACHNRSEDEVGAAPDRGDSTAVAADTAQATPTDSTMGQTPSATDTTAGPQDTTRTTGVDTTAVPSTPTDTTSQTPADTSSTGGYSDSTSMGHDSTDMSMPADSAKQ